MKPTAADSPISSTPAAAAASTNSRHPGDQLRFRTRRRGAAVIVAVRGEADAFTLPLWRDTVREAVEQATRADCAVIIDASRLSFLSLRTVAALARDARRARRHGTEVCLVTTDLHIARLAAGDPRTADLPVRSTVVSALTAIHLHRRATHTPSRLHHTPQITPDQHLSSHGGRAHYLAAEAIPGRDGLPPAVTTTRLPRHR